MGHIQGMPQGDQSIIADPGRSSERNQNEKQSNDPNRDE
jgi:hypothetical protein